jgi:hypothetical protein
MGEVGFILKEHIENPTWKLRMHLNLPVILNNLGKSLHRKLRWAQNKVEKQLELYFCEVCASFYKKNDLNQIWWYTLNTWKAEARGSQILCQCG